MPEIQDWGNEPPKVNDVGQTGGEQVPSSWKPSEATIKAIQGGGDTTEESSISSDPNSEIKPEMGSQPTESDSNFQSLADKFRELNQTKEAKSSTADLNEGLIILHQGPGQELLDQIIQENNGDINEGSKQLIELINSENISNYKELIVERLANQLGRKPTTTEVDGYFGQLQQKRQERLSSLHNQEANLLQQLQADPTEENTAKYKQFYDTYYDGETGYLHDNFQRNKDFWYKAIKPESFLSKIINKNINELTKHDDEHGLTRLRNFISSSKLDILGLLTGTDADLSTITHNTTESFLLISRESSRLNSEYTDHFQKYTEERANQINNSALEKVYSGRLNLEEIGAILEQAKNDMAKIVTETHNQVMENYNKEI